MNFIGRDNELANIKRKLDSDRSESLLMYGRRRVGKSELVKEALKQVEAMPVHYVCRKSSFEENMVGLSRTVAEAFDEPVQFDRLNRLLAYVYKKAKHHYRY